jgi:anhydro-N-acetylmuramic acid kinase
MKIAGVMTGTSCDGLDVACLEFRGPNWRTLWTKSARYPAALRERVLASQRPRTKLTVREFGELHRDLGSWYGSTLARICAANPPDAIGSHGQTVAHFPSRRKQGFTIQLGDPARIAAATGLTVVSNFRDGDMAVGGEGAPLAPRFHQLLARKIAPRGRIAIHNLGGISNLTYIGAAGEIVAFDTGPGNIWIDEAAHRATGATFDRGGKLAARGTADTAAANEILRNEYFLRRPPKSTGRDDFPFELLLRATKARGLDLVATATTVTVQSIAEAYRRFVSARGLDAIYFCGGGAHNRFLMSELKKGVKPIHVGTVDELGFDSKYLESQAFAFFAYTALQGKSLGGAWTGAGDWAPGAHIIPGRNWSSIVRRLARAGI